MFAIGNPGIIAAGNQGPPAGQALFTGAGTFVVPAGVTSICAVAIGAGARGEYIAYYEYWASGGGGGLACSNGLPVTPLETLTITVGEFGLRSLSRGVTVLLEASGGGVTDSPAQGGRGLVGQVLRTGGNGQAAFAGNRKDGGGAAGFASNGTEGQQVGTGNPRGGGGVNPYALGAGAAGGAATGYDGNSYGGGGGLDAGGSGGNGGLGCVYIIYGEGRSFPNNAGPV